MKTDVPSFSRLLRFGSPTKIAIMFRIEISVANLLFEPLLLSGSHSPTCHGAKYTLLLFTQLDAAQILDEVEPKYHSDSIVYIRLCDHEFSRPRQVNGPRLRCHTWSNDASESEIWTSLV
jgi:hypothetical protein